MVVLEPAEFEKLATEIVAEFFTGTPLNDGVFKRANDMGLTPDQIRTLVWSTNTRAHLDLFEKKAEDKMVEFPVADAEYVVRRLYTPADAQPLPVTKTAAAMTMDFFAPLGEVTEKVAEDLTEAVPAPRAELSAERYGKTVVNLRKIASELELNALTEREVYAVKIAALVDTLRKHGGREDLEKNAFAMHGDSALPIINDLRVGLRVTEQADAVKLASAVEVLVDERDPNYRSFVGVLQAFEGAVKYATALKHLRERAGKVL